MLLTSMAGARLDANIYDWVFADHGYFNMYLQ